jgi:DEAD/DEAH box helicase domain-containing protein
LHEFQAAVDAMGSEIRAFTYDGDTPQDARRAIRERANVVLTNPDMLHSGILPHHTKWAKCVREPALHRDRRAALLSRRVRQPSGEPAAAAWRICEFYGSKPQFICCSATIANPKELAEALTESPFELVDRNGAPSGEKYFVFYNPPVVNKQLGIRRGYLQETRRIAREFIERHQQTLVFANSRLATEILVTYLRDAIERGPLPGDAVAAIAAAICRASGARSNASCAMAKSARWWRPMRWSWASISDRWTRW